MNSTARGLTVGIVIISAVFLAQATNVSLDALWHDDGNWYRKATDSVTFRFQGWDKPAPLSKIRHDHYAFSMAKVGLTPTRLVYVGMMALTSLLLWILYRGYFRLGPWVAAIPASLPSMLCGIHIPVGLNAAYAVPSLLSSVATMLVLWVMSTRRTFALGWFTGLIIAVALHFTSAGLASAGVVLSPVALFFAVLVFWPRVRELLAVLAPLAAITVWSTYIYLQGGHRDPTHIPLGTVIDRVESFLDHTSIIPLPGSGAWILSALLGILGLLALTFSGRLFRHSPATVTHKSERCIPLALLWSGWALVTSLPYVVLSPSFRPYDYAFTFAYAWAGAQGIGLVTLIVLLGRSATSWIVNPRPVAILAFLFLVLATAQKNLYDKSNPTKRAMETASHFIRAQLGGESLPRNAQVVIVDPPGNVPHPGIGMVNTGYLRFLLGRDDIMGLIGPSIFPNNPFERATEWTVRMKNLRPNLPILAFRADNGKLKPIDFLLALRGTGEHAAPEAPRFEWVLLRITNGPRPPMAVKRGHRLEELNAFLEESNTAPEDVLFGPDFSRERLLTKSGVQELGFDLNEAVIGRYENGLELVASRLKTQAGTAFAEYLLRVSPEFNATMRINYRVGRKARPLNLAFSTLLLPGDYLLVRSRVKATATPPPLLLYGVVSPPREIPFEPPSVD